MPLLTTLNMDVAAHWLGVTPKEAEFAKWVDWSSPLNFGYLSMPNLSQRGSFSSVPLLRIENLKPASKR